MMRLRTYSSGHLTFPIRVVAFLLVSVAWGDSSVVRAQPRESAIADVIQRTTWEQGPRSVLLGTVAELQVPAGYLFTGREGALRLMEALGNQPSATLIGLLMATDGRFLMSFDFDPIGHVQDDERHQLDPDRILASIQAGTREGNRWRRQNGHAEIAVTGWLVPPNYDPVTHHLVWAVRGRSGDGNPFVNLDTRLLGRRGVMRIKTITDPNSFDAIEQLSRRLISGLQFRSGERYSEVRPGDKVATYGLIGLISGAGTTAALKMGLLQKFGKLILLILAVLGGLAAWGWNALHPAPPSAGAAPPSLFLKR